MKKVRFLSLICLVVVGMGLVSSLEPEARITFTFDDVNKRVFDNVVPILDEHNLAAVLYGEVALLDNGGDWAMSWDQVRELQDVYDWEVGSHTINHPYLTTLSDSELEGELRDSKDAFAREGLDVKSFASPYGNYDDRVLAATARYYESHREAWGGANHWPDIYNDYKLICLEIKHTTSVEEVKGWVDAAIENEQWLIFLMHDVVEGQPREYEYNVDDFAEIVEYIASRPVEVTTVSEGLEYTDEPNLVSDFSFSDLDLNGWTSGWSRSGGQGVVIDTNDHGDVFGMENSVKIIGGGNPNMLISEPINVNYGTEYMLKMYQSVQDFSDGGWAVWVDEFNGAGQWISGQWLGGNYDGFVGSRYYEYSPSSSDVSSLNLVIYSEANSDFMLYLDSVFFNALTSSGPVGGSMVDNYNFEDVSSGWADDWTRNNGEVVIDEGGNGNGKFPKNSLKIVGGSEQRTAFSSMFSIEADEEYLLSFYERIDNYVGGGTAVWINEFDSAGDSWLSGVWLGGVYEQYEGARQYVYAPSSGDVGRIEIHLFSEEGSDLTVFFDSIEFNLR